MSKTASLLLIAFTTLSSFAFAGEPSATDNPAFASYETIRQALLHDKLDGVEDAAKQLATHAQELAVKSDSTAKEALKTAASTATQLAVAKDIASVRELFGDLSDAMIQYRNTLDGERPLVAYCSMAKEHWLQPTKEIGNPYYGQGMATCGGIVESKKSSKTTH